MKIISHVCKKEEDYEKTYLPATSGSCQHALRHVFRRGQPDLPGLHGSAGGAQPVAGLGGISHHRRGPAAAGCGSPGHQPGRRPAGTEQPGQQRVRAVFYLPAVSDHRPLFRHSPLRHGILHRGHPAHAARNRPESGAGGVLAGVLRGGALFLPAPRRDPDLDRQGAQPAVSLLSGGAGAARFDGAPGLGGRH